MLDALVIDDSHAMRAFVCAALEEIGVFQVEEVPTGFQALRELSRKAFDLIIVDVNMPDINGLEVVSFIRKNPKFARSVVLVISTESSERDRKRALVLGASSFLSKPFTAAALRALVEELCVFDKEDGGLDG